MYLFSLLGRIEIWVTIILRRLGGWRRLIWILWYSLALRCWHVLSWHLLLWVCLWLLLIWWHLLLLPHKWRLLLIHHGWIHPWWLLLTRWRPYSHCRLLLRGLLSRLLIHTWWHLLLYIRPYWLHILVLRHILRWLSHHLLWHRRLLISIKLILLHWLLPHWSWHLSTHWPRLSHCIRLVILLKDSLLKII